MKASTCIASMYLIIVFMKMVPVCYAWNHVRGKTRGIVYPQRRVHVARVSVIPMSIWEKMTRDPRFLLELPNLSYLCSSMQLMERANGGKPSSSYNLWSSGRSVPTARLQSMVAAMDMICRRISSLPLNDIYEDEYLGRKTVITTAAKRSTTMHPTTFLYRLGGRRKCPGRYLKIEMTTMKPFFSKKPEIDLTTIMKYYNPYDEIKINKTGNVIVGGKIQENNSTKASQIREQSSNESKTKNHRPCGGDELKPEGCWNRRTENEKEITKPLVYPSGMQTMTSSTSAYANKQSISILKTFNITFPREKNISSFGKVTTELATTSETTESTFIAETTEIPRTTETTQRKIATETSEPITFTETSEPITTTETSEPITTETSEPITTTEITESFTTETSEPIIFTETSEPITFTETSEPITTTETSEPITTTEITEPTTTETTEPTTTKDTKLATTQETPEATTIKEMEPTTTKESTEPKTTPKTTEQNPKETTKGRTEPTTTTETHGFESEQNSPESVTSRTTTEFATTGRTNDLKIGEITHPETIFEARVATSNGSSTSEEVLTYTVTPVKCLKAQTERDFISNSSRTPIDHKLSSDLKSTVGTILRTNSVPTTKSINLRSLLELIKDTNTTTSEKKEMIPVTEKFGEVPYRGLTPRTKLITKTPMKMEPESERLRTIPASKNDNPYHVTQPPNATQTVSDQIDETGSHLSLNPNQGINPKVINTTPAETDSHQRDKKAINIYPEKEAPQQIIPLEPRSKSLDREIPSIPKHSLESQKSPTKEILQPSGNSFKLRTKEGEIMADSKWDTISKYLLSDLLKAHGFKSPKISFKKGLEIHSILD